MNDENDSKTENKTNFVWFILHLKKLNPKIVNVNKKSRKKVKNNHKIRKTGKRKQLNSVEKRCLMLLLNANLTHFKSSTVCVTFTFLFTNFCCLAIHISILTFHGKEIQMYVEWFCSLTFPQFRF